MKWACFKTSVIIILLILISGVMRMNSEGYKSGLVFRIQTKIALRLLEQITFTAYPRDVKQSWVRRLIKERNSTCCTWRRDSSSHFAHLLLLYKVRLILSVRPPISHEPHLPHHHHDQLLNTASRDDGIITSSPIWDLHSLTQAI